MKSFTAMLTTMILLPSAVTEAQTLTITRGGSRPVRQAPAENFTGVARVEMLFETRDPLQASAGSVTSWARAFQLPPQTRHGPGP